MREGAVLANAIWLATNSAHALRFRRALADPRGAQESWLRAQLTQHATSEFGQAHDFAGIRDGDDFVRRVPLSDYDSIVPQVERIRGGARNVLACDAVTHLAPTSGSTGARKLIPFTPTLQRGFSAAVGAWMVDLVRQRPALLGGPAYWSVSPLADASHESVVDDSPGATIPIGFADDADYLGGASAWLVRQALAAPSSLRHIREMSDFWSLTLLALLRQRDLRLLSIWHPSFLELLVGSAESCWPKLIYAVTHGTCPWEGALPPAARAGWHTAPAPRRAAELRGIGPSEWPRWWPRLQVVSCWGEQAAESGWQRLRALLPGVLVQAKGLLATEGVVTIPLGPETPLAVTSHYFEFLDTHGEVRSAHQLTRGERYEVILTNGGGLWRYRLGDMIECAGHVRATPSLRFLGRAGQVSDLRGEKLSETFVADTLRSLWPAGVTPAYAALRGRERAGSACYELLVSVTDAGDALPELAERLERALHDNPHYALARRLGQLEALRVIPVSSDRRREELGAHRGRLGDAKPRVLLDIERD